MGKHTRNRSIGAGAGAVGVSIVAAAALYALSRKRDRSPFTLALWKQAAQGDGSVRGFAAILEHVSEKGIDLDAKRIMWPYLLGVFDSQTSHAEQEEMLKEFRVTYEEHIAFCQAREAEIMSYAQEHYAATAALSSEDPNGASSSPSPPPMSQDPSQEPSSASPGQAPPRETTHNPFNSLSRAGLPEELRQFYEAQRIIVMDAVRTDFKKNSLTTADAIASWLSAALSDSQIYQKLSSKDDWWSGYWVSVLAKYQLDHSSHFSTEQKRQVLRLVNLLSAYAVHDPETGYCQGMSDLAIPFLLLIEDDALAFMCFERLMQKVRRNFAVEDSGIFAQLACLATLLEKLDPTLFYKIRQMGATDCHFAYRMIVVLLRRELTLDQALRLWEMLWADDMLRTLSSQQQQIRPWHDADDVYTTAPTLMGNGGADKGFEASMAAMDMSNPGPSPHLSPIKAPHNLTSPPTQTPNKGSRGEVMNEGVGSNSMQDLVTGSGQERTGPLIPDSTPTVQSHPPPAQKSTVGPSDAWDDAGADLPCSADGTADAAVSQDPPLASGQLLAAPASASADAPLDLFSYFVASVVISQRRRILDDCHDSDDMLKHFQTLRVDLTDCMGRAKQYRAKLGAGMN